MPHRLLVLLLVLIAPSVPAQEALEAILARGHVEHWLVAGPFPSDVDGGIVPRLREEAAVLGTRDFMAPVGGIVSLKPRHLMQVPIGDAVAVWQRAGTQDARLDLGPFFAETEEGIAYAAFYAESAAVQDVYVDLQTVLGARVWLNGILVKEYAPAPLAAAGLERFPVRFLRGMNLMMIEAPGVQIAALAELLGTPPEAVVRELLSRRPLLRGASGWEIGLKLYPMEAAGPIAYVPRLESTGIFAQDDTGLQQQAALILYNHTDISAPEVLLDVTIPRGASAQHTTPPIPPKQEHRELLMVPVSRVAAGMEIPVDIDLRVGAFEASFVAPLTALRPESGGKSYVSTGYYLNDPDTVTQSQETAQALNAVARQTELFAQLRAYGFDLGPALHWMPALSALGENNAVLRDAVALGQAAAHLSYAPVDERLVPGELLARNFAYGLHTSSSALRDSRQSHYAWGLRGVAPQTPQLLQLAERPGLVSDAPVEGLPPLFRQLALQGETWHRHLASRGPMATVEEFRRAVAQTHEAMSVLGAESDLFVHDAQGHLPAEYLIGAADDLRLAVPSILLTGAAPRYYFEELLDAPLNPASLAAEAQGVGDVAGIGAPLTRARMGELAAHPDLKHAHAQALRLVQSAESLSTIAGLLGAQYPDAPLDHAWRQLLFAAAPQRLALPASGQTYSNVLAAVREAAETGAAVRTNAAQYIADNVDTLSGPVTSMREALPLVVFNPSAFMRTDACTAEVELPALTGLQVHDDQGEAVPFAAEALLRRDTRINGARIVFTATDVPGFGYRTYYLTARTQAAEPVRGSAASLENEHLRVRIDPSSGAIGSLVRKENNEEFARAPLNVAQAIASAGETPAALQATENAASPGAPSAIVSRSAPGFQEVSTTAPFLGGTVTRSVRLHAGVPWLDCVLTLEGADLQGKFVTLRFAPPDLGRMAMYGERYGALAARRSQPGAAYRAGAGSGAQPALDWVAMTPGDHVLASERGQVALMPCQVIHGRDHVLHRAAQDIARALLQRGIPASTFPDMPGAAAGPWSGSTEFSSPDDDLAHGQVMRIVVGSPEQNAVTRKLAARLPPPLAAYLSTRLPLGAALFYEDPAGPAETAPVPTLVLAGATIPVTLQQVSNFVEGIQTRGAFPIPPEAYAGEPPAAPAHSGLAVFFNGPMLCTTNAEGSLSLVLAQDAPFTEAADASPQHNRYTWRYRIYPFSGDWREARVPQQAEAFNQPLIAVQTTQHNGLRPQTYSFVDFDSDGFIVSALKPAGYSLLTGEPRNPHNGIIIRGHEAFGRPWQGNLEFMVDLTRAAWADGMEDLRESLQPQGQSVSLEVPPFGIRNLLLLPNTRYSHGQPRDLAPVEAEEDVYAPYWQHESGAPTMDAAAFGMLLRERIPGELVEAFVANHHTRRTVEGIVEFEAPPGYVLMPSSFAYALEPGAGQMQTVSIMKQAEVTAPLALLANTLVDGRRYLAALPREEAQVTATVKRTGAQVTVTVQNQDSVSATGFVEIITPPWAWPALSDRTEDTAHPRQAALALTPGEANEILFRAGEGLPDAAIVVKVAANGNVQYAKIE